MTTLPAFYLSALAVLIGVTLVVVGDTAGKLLVERGTDPIFVAWTRFALAAGLILPICGIARSELRRFLDWRVILRAVFVVLGVSFGITALQTEDIATVFGALFIGPIIAFILGDILLGEHVTWARGVLLLAGFVGVLLVVKPGFGMTPGLAIAACGGVAYGCFLTATRWLAPVVRPRLLLATQLVAGGALLAPFGLAVWPDALHWGIVGLLLISALGSAGGNLIIVMASRVLPAGIIAPLIYTQLISATALGWIVFGDLPDALSFLGLTIILVSGLASLIFARRQG